MAKVASKKTVDNGLAYEFIIKKKDVIERAEFGSFEVIKTKNGIMFKNYTGFHVFTTPYAVGVDGKAVENSLYAWLSNLVEAKKQLGGKPDEQFGNEFNLDGSPMTNGQILDTQKIITEANLIQPMTAFIDTDRAVKASNEYMEWLNQMQKELMEAMAKEAAPEEEAVKADAEETAKVEAMETVGQMAEEALKEMDDADKK